jgi:hypothetical protein
MEGFALCLTDEEQAIAFLAAFAIEAKINSKDKALEATAQDWIEVKRLAEGKADEWIDEQSENAVKIVHENFALIQGLADELTRKGCLSGDEIHALIDEFLTHEAT